MSAALPLVPPCVSQVVAAGNSYESACLMSPASSPWVSGGHELHCTCV